MKDLQCIDQSQKKYSISSVNSENYSKMIRRPQRFNQCTSSQISLTITDLIPCMTYEVSGWTMMNTQSNSYLTCAQICKKNSKSIKSLKMHSEKHLKYGKIGLRSWTQKSFSPIWWIHNYLQIIPYTSWKNKNLYCMSNLWFRRLFLTFLRQKNLIIV